MIEDSCEMIEDGDLNISLTRLLIELNDLRNAN